MRFKYVKCVPVTGLQYKCDPGLPITYVAFAFITVGVMLAAIPHRQVWAATATDRSDNQRDSAQTRLTVGGTSRKAKRAFEKEIVKVIKEFGEPSAAMAEETPSGAETLLIEENSTSEDPPTLVANVK